MENKIPILRRFVKVLRNYPLLFAVLINAIFFALALALYTPHFKTVDDVGMLLRVSAFARVENATPFMLHSHIFIGQILKYLYQSFGSVPWYGVYYLSLLFLSHVLILYVFLKRSFSVINILFYFLYFILVGVTFIIHIQFTILSALLCISGFLLVLFPNSRLKRVIRIKNVPLDVIAVLGIVLVVIGSMVRWSSFQMAALLVGPLILVHLIFSKNAERVRVIAMMSLLVISAFALNFVNQSYYKSDPGYSQWYDFRENAKSLYDYKVLDNLSEDDRADILESVEWSVNDYTLLKGYFYSDKEVYTIDKIKKIQTMLKNYTQKRMNYSLGGAMDIIIEVFNSPIGQSSFLIFALSFLFVNFRKEEILKNLSLILSIVFVCLILIFFLKPPLERLYYSYFFFLAIAPQFYLINEVDSQSGLLPMKPATLVFIGLLLLNPVKNAVSSFNEASLLHRSQSLWLETVFEKMDFTKDEVLVTWGQSIPLEFVDPFENPKFLENFKIYHIGTDQLSTAANEILEEAKIENIYDAILNDDRVFVVLRNSHKNVKIASFMRYVRERMKTSARYNVVYENSLFTVYDFNNR